MSELHGPTATSYSWRVRVLIGLLACIPFALILQNVFRYAIDMPYFDAWDVVPYLQKMYDGTLTWTDMLDQHNESRILFPRLFMFSLARLTDWNTHYELGGILLMAALIGLLLIIQSHRTARATLGAANPWVAVPISALVFSFMQHGNWTQPFTFVGYMNILAMITGLMALSRPPLTHGQIAAGALSGVVATYSYANGIFFWGIGLVAVFLVQRESGLWRIKPFVVWGSCAIVIAAAYFAGYVKPGCMPPLSYFLHHPLEFIGYILVFLGAPVAAIPTLPISLSVIAGAIGVLVYAGCALAVLFLPNRPLKGFTFWIGLGGYAGLSAIAAALGRSGFGLQHALSSRYTAMSGLLWISDIAMGIVVFQYLRQAHAATPRRWARTSLTVVTATLCMVITGSFIVSSVYAADVWRTEYAELRTIRNELLAYAQSNRTLDLSLPDTKKLKVRAQFLTAHGLSLFRDKKPFFNYRPVTRTVGSLDPWRGDFVTNRVYTDGAFLISGSAYDTVRREPVRGVLLVSSNTFIIGHTVVDEVRAHHPADIPANSGWSLTVNAHKLPVGTTKVDVYAILQDGIQIAPIGSLDLTVSPTDEMRLLVDEFVDTPENPGGYADAWLVNPIFNMIIGYGWAWNPYTHAPGQRVFVTDETDRVLAYGTVKSERPDVARNYRAMQLANCGWKVDIPRSKLSRGPHTLRAYVLLPEERKAVRLMHAHDVIIP